MAIHKFKDWRGWLDGLRSKATQAFFTSLFTLATTNGIASSGIDALKDVGMNWKAALMQCAIHAIIAASAYIKDQPDPPVITEECPTEHLKKP